MLRQHSFIAIFLLLFLALDAIGLMLASSPSIAQSALISTPTPRPQPRRAAPGSTEFHVCNSQGGYSQTIQSAVDAAQPGDMIKVASGVYTEIKVIGIFTYNLYISKTVNIFGGYSNACNDWATQNYTANVTTIRPSTSAISVVSIVGASTATLDGFTITGGGGVGHGGGIRINNSNALISHNIITGNISYLLGGGIWVQNGAPTITDNRIQNNFNDGQGQAAQGGGIELEGTQATVANNIIANNVISSSNGSGGGIDVSGGGPVTISNNSILTNTAAITGTGYGGGVAASLGVTATLSNNLIQGNSANSAANSGSGNGGGVYILSSPVFTLTGNTILQNTAGYKDGVYLNGGGMDILSSSGLLASNMISGNIANGKSTSPGNGGGLAVYNSTLTIQGNQILNNLASLNWIGNGGGLYAQNSSVTIDSTRFDGNQTGGAGLGGGLDFLNTPYTLTNAILNHNHRDINDDTIVDGLSARGNSPGFVINNTFANHHSISIRTEAPLTATNNIIINTYVGISATAAVSVTFNDFYNNSTANNQGFSLDSSNIVINPNLDATFHLVPGSPAIDAGTHTNAPDHDIDGEPRPMIGTSGFYRVDMGADEFTGLAQRTVNIDRGQADLTIIGPGGIVGQPDPNANNWMGLSVMGADVSGDGRADLLMAAHDWAEDFNTLNATGRLFGLFNFGTRTVGTIDLYTRTADLTVVSKYPYQHVGQAFASGDLNNDGKRDLIVSSNQSDGTTIPWPIVFVLFGGPSLNGTRTLTDTVVNSTTRPADFMLRAPAKDYLAFGNKNALAVGDISGDGIDDLLVGDSAANDIGLTGAGAVFAVFGGGSITGTFNLSTTAANFTLYGPATNAHLEKFAVGRINNDSQIDLVARTDSTAYVLFGPRSGTFHLFTTPADVTITGLQAGGVAVMDFNGDGQDDLILGSGNTIYVIPGPLTGGQTFNVTSGATLTITNISASTFAVGDVVGDSRRDLIIGAPSEAKPRVVVVPGGTAATGTLDVLDLATLIAADNSNAIRLLGIDVAAGDLDGDGKGDLILGSLFNNTDTHPANFEKAGKVFVIYGSGTRQLFLPLILK